MKKSGVNNKLTILILVATILFSIGLGYGVSKFHIINKPYSEELHGAEDGGEGGGGSSGGIAQVPTSARCKSGLVYNGESQTLTTTSGTGYSFVTSTNSATDAGTHLVTAILQAGYTWSDGTTGYQYINCTIQKATSELTASATSGSALPNQSKEFQVGSTSVPGTYSYDPVSGVNISLSTISDYATKVTVSSENAGEYSIKINFTPTDTTNYAKTSITYTFTVSGNAASISCANMSVQYGNTATISCNVSNAGSNYSIVYGYNNYNYITLDANTGAITTKAAGGPTEVTAVLKNSSGSVIATDTCNITVSKATPTVSVNPVSGTVNVNDNTSFSLSSSVNGQFSLVIDDTSIVRFNGQFSGSFNATAGVNNSVQINGKKQGETTITVTFNPESSNYNKVTKTYTVTVNAPVVYDVTIYQSVSSLIVGGNSTFNAIVEQDDHTVSGASITWSSSNTSVATVDATGKVVAVAPGTAVITATYNGYVDSKSVTVTAPVVYDVTIYQSVSSLIVGGNSTFKARVEQDDHTVGGASITWSSSNTSVATVDATGKVVAVAPGTAVITATYNGYTDSKTVTVSAPVVYDVTIYQSVSSLIVGGNSTFKARVEQDDHTVSGASVMWSSSNTSVATVDATGKVVAVAPGTAVITANYNGYTDSKTLNVTTQTVAPQLTVDNNAIGVKLNNYKQINVSYTGNGTVTFKSNNTSIATVDANGKVYGVKVGNTTISVCATDVTACKTVNVNVYSNVAATRVSLNKTTLTLESGSKYQLIATISPSTVTDTSLIWSSSNTEVATVDEYGQVIALDAGTAVITVTTANSQTATCTVTVNEVTGTGGALSNINTLSSLVLSSGTINFSPTTLSYIVEVDNNITSLTYTSTLTDGKSGYVSGYEGNKTVNLNIGENTFMIKVKAEDGSIRTYTLTIVRRNSEGYSYLVRDIEVTNYAVDFKNGTIEYVIYTNGEKQLDFVVSMYSDQYSYQITGNNNLTNGSVVTIKARNANGSQEEEYRFNIRVSNGSIVDVPNTGLTTPKIIVIAVASFVLVGSIIIYAQSLKSKKREQEKQNNEK